MCFYQTLVNVALILEQVSNYDDVLREQASIKKSANMIQSNMISEEKIVRPIVSMIAKEHMPNGRNDKNANNKSQDVNENEWCKPKKYM